MFGYVNINKQKMSDDEKKIYQSYYCGMCQNLKEHYGKRGQLLLNYDMVFLVVLLTGLYEPQEKQIDGFSCALHPIKKKSIRNNEILDYASHMNLILAYHNLMDDYNDQKNVAKKALASALRKDYEVAKEMYPRQVEAVERCLKMLEAYEEQGENNIDLVAGLTGEMLGEIFAYKKDEWYEDLKNMGYQLGKFIYVMDAYEDLKKDIKKKNYNPLISLYEETRISEQNENRNYEIIMHRKLTEYMSETAKIFERLPILLHADILRNILYSGVWMRYDYMQVKQEKTAEKHKNKEDK